MRFHALAACSRFTLGAGFLLTLLLLALPQSARAQYPSISSYSVNSGRIGSTVSIFGSNFGSSGGTVKFYNGVTASFSTWNSTSITCTVPAGATNTGGITVTTSSGEPTTGPTFTVLPTITGATPNPTTTGTSVTISGGIFGSPQGTSTVTFNGVNAGTATSWSASSIQIPVPANATTGSLVVTTSTYGASNNYSFTVSPHLTSLSVTTGPRGTAFTISGSGFGATQGSNTVTVGGSTATVTSWGAGSISTTVPSGAPIAADNVIVTVNSVASNALVFTVTSGLANTTTTVAANPVSPSVYGTIITFTANVSPVLATGTVTFKDGGTTVGTGTLSGGVATLNISWLSIASHSITAVYGGNSNYNGSTSSVLTQVINAPTITKPSYCVF